MNMYMKIVFLKYHTFLSEANELFSWRLQLNERYAVLFRRWNCLLSLIRINHIGNSGINAPIKDP